jgi:hypothetical protein
MSQGHLSEDELKDLAQQQAAGGPQPGEVYRHYKGGEYTVVARAVMEETLRPLVVYRSHQKGTTWARTLDNWGETVEVSGVGGVPRFRLVSPEGV